MCGNNIGSLSVDMVNGVTGSRKELKKISGNQKDHWFETEANIPAGSNFKVRKDYFIWDDMKYPFFCYDVWGMLIGSY